MFLGSTSCTKSAREAAGSGSEELKKTVFPFPCCPVNRAFGNFSYSFFLFYVNFPLLVFVAFSFF